MKIDINNSYTHSLYILRDTISAYREKTGLPRHEDAFLCEIDGQIREIENQLQEDFDRIISRFSNRLYHLRMAVVMHEKMQSKWVELEPEAGGVVR